MSFILRSSRRAMLQAPRAQARCFSRSSFNALKETDRDEPNRAEKTEKHKQDLLNKHKTGNAHWKAELASNSEEAIKGDREPSDTSEEGIKKLQEQTKNQAEEK